MGNRITKKVLRSVATSVLLSARENAHASVRENHPATEIAAAGGTDCHPQFDYYFRSTVEMIVDQLQSERHARDHADYECPKVLTAEQAATVKALVLA